MDISKVNWLYENIFQEVVCDNFSKKVTLLPNEGMIQEKGLSYE